MNFTQPYISIGKVMSSGIGTQDIKIKNRNNNWKNVSSGSTRNEGENVLVLFLGDDFPVVIGDAGYRISEDEA